MDTISYLFTCFRTPETEKRESESGGHERERKGKKEIVGIEKSM